MAASVPVLLPFDAIDTPPLLDVFDELMAVMVVVVVVVVKVALSLFVVVAKAEAVAIWT
jgi:hypothetical protein